MEDVNRVVCGVVVAEGSTVACRRGVVGTDMPGLSQSQYLT